MAKLTKSKGYNWDFENIGGTTRVKITTGDDLKHLGELDPKMWTVLSCPVKGLEIDEKSMSFMDLDADGKIRISDVVATAEWVTSAVKNADLLLEGADSIDIENFNQSDAKGAKLYAAAKQILQNLGKEGSVICLADTADSAAIFAKTRFNGDGVITELTAEDPNDKAVLAAAVKCTLYGIDPEGALERTNKKFIRRFNHVECRAEEQGKTLRDMTLAEMDSYWDEAKALERQ